MSGTFFKIKPMSLGDLFWNDTFGELINLRLIFDFKHRQEKPSLSNSNWKFLKSKFYKKRGATFFYDITRKLGLLDFTQYRSKSSSF